MNSNQIDKAKAFYDIHVRDGCFLMPNAWDIGSAKILVSAGFKAIGTTSAGMAFSQGRPDNAFCAAEARLNRKEMFAQIEPIVESVSVPVNADLEDGFGREPEAVAQTIALAIKTGAVGGNIEDYTGDPNNPLYDIDLSVERIKAAREIIDKSGVPFVLVARTDAMNIGKKNNDDEAISRVNLYREAGADCLFSPGASDRNTIARFVQEVDGPLNVVMGLTGTQLSVDELADLGVRRVSIGGSLARSLYFQMQRSAKEMFENGTFTYAENQISQGDLNRLFERDL